MAFNHDSTKLVSTGWYSLGGYGAAIWDISGATPVYQRTLSHGSGTSVRAAAFSSDGTKIVTGGRGQVGADYTVRVWEAAAGGLIRTLTGHTSWVASVAFSPDGTKIASSSYDFSVRIWDFSLSPTEPHTESVLSVVWSPDGTKLTSGGADYAVKIWNSSSTTAAANSLRGHTDVVSSVAYNHNGTRIVSGSHDENINIWNASNGAFVRTLTGHTDAVHSVAYNHNGTRIVSGSSDDTVKVWNASNGTLIRTLSHVGDVYSVAYSHDGTKIASGGVSNIKIWDASNGALLHTLTASYIYSVAFNHDGTRIAGANLTGGNYVTIWDISIATPALLRRLRHTAQVRSAAWSPDGTKIVSGSGDNNIRVWDAAAGGLIRTLTGHTSAVVSTAFSPNGRKIASGSLDNSVRTWDFTLSLTEPHTESVLSVAWSPDGTRLISSGADYTVKFWNPSSTTAAVNTLYGHTADVNSVAYNHDGTQIASGSGDNTAKVWNASTGAVVHTLSGHTAAVNSVAYNHDGTQIASGSVDDSIKVWNAATGAVVHTLSHGSDVYSVAFNHDGTKIASGGVSNIKIWNAATGALLHTVAVASVHSVAFNHDGTKLAGANLAGGINYVTIWDVSIATPAPLRSLPHTAQVRSAAWSSDGTMIVSGGTDNSIKVWHGPTGALIKTLTGHTADVRSVAFSPDGTKIASASADDSLRIWNTPSLTPHTGDVHSVAWSPDGTQIVSGSGDFTINIWNLSSPNTPASTLYGHTDAVSSVAFNHDGTQVASGSDDDDVKVWNASTGAVVHTLTGHTGDVTSVAFNPDGTTISSASKDDSLKHWNASNGMSTTSTYTDDVADFLSVAFNHNGTRLAFGNAGNSLRIKEGPPNYIIIHTLSANTVASVAFNHDGTRLVSGSAGTGAANQTAKIWDLSITTPAVLHTLTHGSAVHSVDFSPDGTMVVSGGGDNNIKLWNADDGTLIRTITGHTGAVNSVAFSPDGTKIASGGDDDTVRLWNVLTGAQITRPVSPTDPTDPTDPPVVIDPYRTDIESVRFSANGAKLVNGRMAGYVDIWEIDLTAKRAVISKSLKQGQHWVLDADLSPDGKQIVSAGSNIVLQIADAETGLIAHTLKEHTDWTTAAVYSPDGALIASGSKDKTARLWNASTGALVHTLEGHIDTVGAVVFSSDGALLATGSQDNTARIYNVSTGALLHTLTGHTGAVHAAVFSPDGKTLATASDDGTARIYNVSTGALVHTLEGHTGAATAVVFSPIGLTLVTGDSGGARRVWSVSTGELEATYGSATDPLTTGFLTDPGESRHRGSVQALAFLDGKTLISSGSWVDLLMQELDIGDPPTVEITGPTDAVSGSFDVAIAFSEAVTGFEASDITVTNGSVSSLTGSGSSYTAKIAVKPLFEGTVTVSIPAGAAQDSDTEGSLAASFEATAELGAPTVAVKGPAGPVGLSAFEVTIEFDQDVSGLEAGDIAVTGGTAGALTGSGAAYAVSITPSADAEKATVSIPAGAAQNSGGDANEASNTYEAAIDSDSPTAAVTGPEGPVNGAPFDVSVEFSEAVTGFDADDVSVEGGTAASVNGSGMTYTVSIDPEDGFEETLTVSIPAGAANDTAGNASQASSAYEVQVDQTAPTVTVTGPSGPLGPAPLNVTITFSESVKGFASSDVAVVGGSAKISGSGMDYTAVVTPADDFQGMLTVSIGAGAAQDSAGNGNAASEAYSVEIVRSTSFTVSLRRGLNMLHVPVNDPRLERLSDLYAVLGGSADVQFLMSYSSDASRFVSYADGLAGTSSDLPLSDETAVLASMKAAKLVTFTGGLLKSSVPLRAGINMIGVTRSGVIETVGGLAALSTKTLSVITLEVDDAGNAQFIDEINSDKTAKGGDGYLVFAESKTVLTFDGGAWKNEPSSAASPVEAVVYDPSSTPLLVVEGSVAREDNLAPLNGLEVSITNLQTGQTASDLAGRSAVSGGFSLPLLALTGDSYAVGDAFDLRVSDSSGTFGGVRSVRIVLDKETASTGRIDIGQLLATAVPMESSLLPNYPNPFNPETWIPFDLSEESRVKVTIYNAAGQTVRVLELGHLPAGAYRSRSKAAYWDGRNALGESAASGVYFVRIEAGSFTALRRMVVLK